MFNKFGLSVNRKQGFVSVNVLWAFTLLVVWGSHGNCYRVKRLLRFDWKCGVHRFKVTWWQGHRETDIYVYRVFQPWKWIWNSEHLAARYGTTNEESYRGPSHTIWNSRWLGQHIIC